MLHLNLKRKWFDMILSGEKVEEYREIKPYWIRRFVDCCKDDEGVEYYGKEAAELVEAFFEGHFDLSEITLSKYYTILFSNGYAKNRDQFEIKRKAIHIRQGKKEWGAESGVLYFVLELGDLEKPNEYHMCSECGKFYKKQICKNCYPNIKQL